MRPFEHAFGFFNGNGIGTPMIIPCTSIFTLSTRCKPTLFKQWNNKLMQLILRDVFTMCHQLKHLMTTVESFGILFLFDFQTIWNVRLITQCQIQINFCNCISFQHAKRFWFITVWDFDVFKFSNLRTYFHEKKQ